MEKEKKALAFAEERLQYLWGLKRTLSVKQREWKKNYIGQKTLEADPTKSSYDTNIAFSIINSKAAEILNWVQEYEFIPLDWEAKKASRIIKKVWDYEWITSKTDKEIMKVIYSALKYGNWYMYEGLRTIKRKIKEPYLSGDEIKWNENTMTEYDGVYCEYIPWENFYHDWYDIETANEAIWIRTWDRRKFLNTFSNNPNYTISETNIPKGQYYYLNAEGDVEFSPLNEDNLVTELRYYNKAEDSLIVLVNGVEIRNSIIPYQHKELPFCSFSNYALEDRTYDAGEYEMLENDINYKDALRALNIDVIKAQFGFTTIDPDADFDETTVEIGTNKFARVEKEAISHFSPNINANSVIEAERKVDEDLIIKTWIDFKSQILGASETATKTESKIESARKRTNLLLKQNAYNFFARLARLRMSNIKFEYKHKTHEIPVKGQSMDKDGNVKSIKNGYGTFTVAPWLISWMFNVLPITESILWVSEEKEKNKLLEFGQIFGNLIWEDGKPIMNPKAYFVEGAKAFKLDSDLLLWETPNNISAASRLDKIKKQMKGVSNDANDPSNPNYVPPEQRNQSNPVPLIGSLANNK